MTAETTGEMTDETAAAVTDAATARGAEDRDSPEATARTTVTVRCTGHVREAVGAHELEFAFEGTRLREFLAAFADAYDVADLLVVDPAREPDPTARLWARPPGEFPGWRPDAEAERPRPYGRVYVDGRFSYRLAGLETPLADGARIALLYPFLFAPRSPPR